MEIHRVSLPQKKTTLQSLKQRLNEVFFPDDPLHQFKNQPFFRKVILGFQYVFPIFLWGSEYRLNLLKADVVSGLTIASLAIPQGISYAKLANLPPIIGLYSSFVPPLIYSILGSSKDLAVGPVSIASLVMGSMLREEVSPEKEPILYLQLAFTATFFAGVFQASLGLLRLGFIVDFLSKATLLGFMGGAAEGIAVGRTFASLKNYQVDGNKEMMAIGVMNMAGSCASCYVTTGSFSRSAVNYNAGCRTALSNIVMAAAVLITMLFLMPLFYHTPNVILAAIIITAVVGLIDLHGMIRLWKVDKLDFLACICAFLGVLFISVQIGLAIAVAISIFKILVHVTRPNTAIMGNVPGTRSYRNLAHYKEATRVPAFLILGVESPIYFANCMYLQERILRWVREEEERAIKMNESSIKCIVLDMAAVTTIDTSGMDTLSELKKTLHKRSIESLSRPKLFWVSAAAPLASVILSTIISFAIKAQDHGISIEGIAVGRTFASLKNYQVDGNKEMMAIGVMNMAGSCASCYVTTGSFSRSAVNYNAGCRTALSNIVMAAAVLITMLFLMPLFYHTPNVILAAIIITAVVGLIDLHGMIRLWKVDKLDFLACICAFLGVLFISVQIGLAIAVAISIFKILVHVTRPNTAIMGNVPGTRSYRNLAHYKEATRVPAFLILGVESPIYFANCMYLQERILRWVREEEERAIKMNESSIKCIVLDMAAVTTIDTSGMDTLSELKKTLHKRSIELVLANPVGDVAERMNQSGIWEQFGSEGIYMTVAEAVAAVSSMYKDQPRSHVFSIEK
ncbi:putative sulfate transporter 3.3 [Cocos nucifera]|nr:putative sulfate transporter 3.3 [Cocos nucifera]